MTAVAGSASCYYCCNAQLRVCFCGVFQQKSGRASLNMVASRSPRPQITVYKYDPRFENLVAGRALFGRAMATAGLVTAPNTYDSIKGEMRAAH